MSADKKNIICSFIAALLAIGVFFGIYKIRSSGNNAKDKVTVGFIYDGDKALHILQILYMQLSSSNPNTARR